ncbi:hypothetical protein E4T43_00013 [Aureobasidium subglaciale]|nr:hypothetical protein E4T43_00013 [Aureobasidium subglaciale]
MRSSFLYALLPTLALAAPRPQDINLDAVDAAPDPVIVTPAVAVVAQTATAAAIAAQTLSAAAAIATDPASTDTTGIEKRDDSGSVDLAACNYFCDNTTVTVSARDTSIGGLAKRDVLEARDVTCAKQPTGAGPVTSPDTPEAFAANQDLSNAARNAITPNGYGSAFTNLQGATTGSNFLMQYTLNSYDTLTCASRCDRDNRCVAFNVYVERDPSLDPNPDKCPSPASTTNYKCTTWGVPISSEGATNTGQWRASFQILMAGSNGYNKNAAPNAINGFNGPYSYGGAIQAPLDAEGHDTYVGFKYYPFSQRQGYTPGTCASACNAQTAYNKAHPAKDGSYKTCAFFNSYVLSKNGVPQGLYCSMYSQTWAASYGTNYGQYRGSDRYTVSESYGYSTYFNLADSNGNNLSQRYSSALFYYGTSQPTYQYYLDSNRNLRSSSTDLFCLVPYDGLAYSYFLQQCSDGLQPATCTIASGNLQCVDSSGKPYNFAEYSGAYIVTSQSTPSNQVTVKVSPVSS